MQKIQVNITVVTLLKILAVVAGVFLIWKAWQVVFIIVAALFLASLLQPVADWAHKYHIPRGVTVISAYVIGLGLLALTITLMVPTLIDQALKIGPIFGARWESLQDVIVGVQDVAVKYDLLPENGFASIQTQAAEAISRLMRTLTGIFGGIAAFVIVLVIAFYLVAQDDKAKTLVHDWVAVKHQKFVLNLIDELQAQMSRWFAGQATLSLIIGILVYTALTILGIEGALVFALFAGLLEFIPYLGPILSSIPIIFVAFTQSPLLGVLALGALVVIQQLENHIIVPKVMQKAVGLNPLISIISMLVGAKLFGVAGALLAIPFATALMVVVKEVRAYIEK
ncbi:MAG: AI-2E family transporter [Patescibacteria group bacterium]|nr:AI-2E family transporter [Patescibacteria group bacterium]